MATTSGSCLCGGVTFDITGEPEDVMVCYCTHCRKNAGAPAQYVGKFKADSVKVHTAREDLLKTYVLSDTTSGHEKHKIFCGDCGCTLWTIPMSHCGAYLMIRVPLLDDGLTKFPAKVVFFVESKPDSIQHQGLKEFPKMPVS